MPPVITDKNGNYGGPAVTQKYSPLQNIGFVAADQAFYSALLTNRRTLLLNMNILPQPLNLAAPNWPAMIAAEAGHAPPLVVISSNRANWILAGINAANRQLAALGGLANFDNASDLRALTAWAVPPQEISPPIYCPTRIGPAPLNRNVYVVVHSYEYQNYKATLAGTGITVIGWAFTPPVPVPPMGLLAGFGASRFAAIEFCKALRNAATVGGVAPWDFAWLFDDNVVALTNFPGFATVEAAMTPAHVCAGFHGGSQAETSLTNRTWARNEILAGRGIQTANLPISQPPGILQQAILWNIAYLDANRLNFGPVYVASGEDVSIGNYFNINVPPILYFYYVGNAAVPGINVRKEVTTSDGSGGAGQVNTARSAYAGYFADAESAIPAAPAPPPPPPVQVQPIQPGDGGVQTITNFIVNRVLPISQMAGQAGNVAVQNAARSQGVEQITCGAMGLGWIAPAARTATFQFNGAAPQAVVRRNIP